MKELESLNPEQRAAVIHTDGPLLVVAGAGTGKTQVITRRIGHLIASNAAEPYQILALTFTEKAAREMAERLYDLVGWQAFSVAVMTFHAFGTELLGRYATHIGRSVRGGLINDVQKSLLLQQHLDLLKLSYYGPQSDVNEFLEGVVGYISRLQDAGIGPDEYSRYVDKLRAQPQSLHSDDLAEEADQAALYRLYDEIKLKTGTFDHHDQLQIPLNILQQRPNIAERLRREYRFVMVDEYQDTNTVQDELLRSFIEPDGNLVVVGDDDQAIYGFRGAEIGNILDFADHFKVTRPVVLTRNYRSGQKLLDAAYRLIKHNDPERLESKLGLDKRLVSARAGVAPMFLSFGQAQDEIEGVADELGEQLAAGATPSDLAVLAVSHAPLQRLAKVLRDRDVPFALSTQANIFEQPELSQLWHLLGWIGLQASDEAIGQVILGPYIGWTAEQHRRLLAAAREETSSLEDRLRAQVGKDDAAGQLVDRLDEWRRWATDLPVSQVAYRLVFETGLSDRLVAAARQSDRIIRVFEDLQRLLAQMQDYESVTLDPLLAGYLKSFPKPPGIEVTEPVGDAGGVQLLTVHAAKGLEFDTVFIVGCTQRNWSARSGGAERQVPEALRRRVTLPPEHEYRRLMYVATTRAKRRLFLSAATQTADGRRQGLSPFVHELFGDRLPTLEPKVDLAKSPRDAAAQLRRYYPLSHHDRERTLPFETSDGWLELSVNDLGQYDYCPYEFSLESVLGIRQPLGPQLAFGSAIHETIRAFYQARLRSETITLAELQARLDEQWSDRGYPSPEMAELQHRRASEAIERLFNAEQRAPHHIISSEADFKLKLPDAKLVLKGRIDAVFGVEGGVEIRDFKTGRKTEPERIAASAKESFQLRSYALAYQQLQGQAPALVTLDYVVSGVEGSAKLSATVLENHRAKLTKMAQQIRRRDFAPTTKGRHQCAAWKYFGTASPEDEEDNDA